MEREKFLREVLEPGREFTPIPFWFFNDAFDEEKVKNQLADYVEKGVDGIVLHPRIGVPREMPYLSEAYFDAVRFIVKTAAELGMKVVLYDEGMYPSGSAHGMVVEENPEYASKGIVLLDVRQAEEKLSSEESARVIAELPGGRKIVYGFAGGTIRGIHFGEDDGEPGAPKAADILNPDAVDTFIRLTHDRYYEELKEYFGSTVIAFFTDEPSALGRNAGRYRPWVRGMEEELAAAGGKLTELEGLFVKTGAVAGREDIEETVENPTVLLYRRLIKEKLREIFYARLSGWCERHGISLIGHPAESDDIEEELYFHIPGQDLIMRRVAPETGGLREFDSVQAKLSADIARHLGRRRNANECFGVCYRNRIPWYMTAGDMKWYIDWLGLRGVNLFIPHAFYYSVAGARKGERPPDVGPNNIWWRHYRRFSDYMKRLSYLMTDSVNGARIAVLCDNNRVPYEEIACLYENQVEFNYLPAAVLEGAQVKDGAVCVQGYAYERVINLLGQAYEDRFRGKLGELLWTAARGTEVLSPDGRGCSGEEIVSGHRGTGIGEVRLSAPCSGLRKVALHRQGVDMVLFGNEGSTAVSVDVTVPGLVSPLFVDLWRGKCYRTEGAGETFHLYLRPSETVLVLDAAEAEGAGKYRAADGAVPERASGSEALAESKADGAAPERASGSEAMAERMTDGVALGSGTVAEGTAKDDKFAVEHRGADWYLAEYPDWTERFALTEKAENRAVYSLRYTVPESAAGEQVSLRFRVAGDEMVECFCNGVFVDVSFWGEHRFDVGAFLRQGENEIRLVVTGNAANVYENAGIAFGLKGLEV